MALSNHLKELLKTNWHWLICVAFTLLCCSFLFGKGIYNFTDSGYYSLNPTIAKTYFVSKLGLFSNTDGFYFGYNNSQRSFASLLITFYQFILTSVFGSNIGQALFYGLYYLVTFYFSLKLLRLIFANSSEEAIRWGALFMVFNPVSLLLLTLSSVGITYGALIVFSFVVLKYLRTGRYGYLFLAVIEAIYLLYYLRFVPIILGLIVIIASLLGKRLAWFLNLRRILLLGAVCSLAISPFIVGNVFSLKNGSSVLSGYQSGFQTFEEANYNFKKSFLFSLSHPGGFTPSVLSHFYNPDGRVGIDKASNSTELYKAVQILFTVGFLCLAIYIGLNVSTEKKRKYWYLSGLTLFFIGLNTVGYFVSLDQFNLLNRTLLAFLYNDYGFLQFFHGYLFTFLLVLMFDDIASINLGFASKKVLRLCIVVYLLFNISPYLLQTSFYGLKKLSDIPADYKDIFLDGSSKFDREAALFIPYYWLKLSWAPHFINVNFINDSKYESIIVPNFRVAGSEFITIYNDVYNHLSDPALSNIAVFNIKSLFLFKNVEDENDRIDSYGVRDKESKIPLYIDSLENRNDISTTYESADISQYRFNDAPSYDFLVYSPKSIFYTDPQDFFARKVDLSTAPVLLRVATDTQPIVLQNAGIFYKWGINNSNKYYIEVEKTASPQELSIQLNQMFSKGWSIYSISKEEFDAIKCTTEVSTAKYTSNSKCAYSSIPIDIRDVSFLSKKPLESTHLAGNLFGNFFQVTNLHSNEENGKTYFALFFRGQIYYELALVVSVSVVAILLVLAALQEIVLALKKQV